MMSNLVHTVSFHIKLLIQYLLPHHLVSRLAGVVARCQVSWLKDWMIKRFIACYKVDLTEAEKTNPEHYVSFNAFFTRTLQSGARPIASDGERGGEGVVISPVDGKISQIGDIERNCLTQVKGKCYSVEQLFGGPGDVRVRELAAQFEGGRFATLYLSPRDYHRIHMPLAGKLRQMIYVPGNLFAVNDFAATNIANLFGRNERVIAVFDTDIGTMVLVLVGAMIVGSIGTSWAGVVTPQALLQPLWHHATRQLQTWYYGHDVAAQAEHSRQASQREASRPAPTQTLVQAREVALQRGDEVGYFQLGSTVILLFARDAARKMQWQDTVVPNSPIKMGQSLGRLVII
jgi:phosphatidylserine decarboxylase